MFSKLSFKAKLQLVLGFLSLMALANVGYLAFLLQKDLIADKSKLLERSAESIADKVDRNLFERYGDVQAYAMSEPARSGDPGRITRFMTDMMGAYAPVYDVMMVLDKKGNVIAVNAVDKAGKELDPSGMIGKNYADEDWFRESISGKVAAGAAHYTDLREDADTAKYASTDGRVMIFSSPIRDAKTGEITGVWSNRMSWKDVVEDIVFKESEKLKDEKIHAVSAFMVNKEKTILVHHDKAKVLKSKAEGLDEFFASKKQSWTHKIDDQDEIRAEALEAVTIGKGYVTYPGHGWIYMLRAPASDPDVTLALLSSLIGLSLVMACAFFAALVAQKTANSLESIIERLRGGSQKVAQTAGDVTSASHLLSEASTEQASALQETAASIEEINAMIKKSTDNSRRSQEVADQSAEIARKGKDSVDKMALAINDINVSNEAIMKQISESNQQFSEIARVIAEIGNKTKVINDIVFQTKLLSFNASVEAARAGEHGKGFAVVAEEVGNLAQMSGNAAKEISEMLEGSIKNVESIVEGTKQKVERLIADGRQKVQSGIAIADQCGTVLTEVVTNVEELHTMVAEISTAAQEQSTGVNEITKAMNELDQTTHANATTSQQVSGYASTLSNESSMMDSVVVELTTVVKGGGTLPSRGEPKTFAPILKSSKVVSIQEAKKSPAPEKTPESAAPPVVKKLKKVSSDEVPVSDDPRFKEV